MPNILTNTVIKPRNLASEEPHKEQTMHFLKIHLILI